MRKIATIAMALTMGMMMLVSCKKDKDNNTDNRTVFYASIESRTQDRTSLNPATGQVKWTAGDKIKIANANGETALFTLQSGANTTRGVFACDSVFDMAAPFVAVYPHTADVDLDEGIVTFSVPATQNITQTGTFANGANPMVAYGMDENLQFKNLCGGLGIQLYGSGAHVSRITLEDPYDRLNGEFEANYEDPDDQYHDDQNEGTQTITLTCDVMLPASADEAAGFYAVLPTNTLRPGVAVKIYDGAYQIGEIYVVEGHGAQVYRNLIKYFPPVEITMFDSHEEVDLGLPSSLRWATCNIGANTPEEYGDYIAWAEAYPKDEYTSGNYSFPTYNPTVLEPENDAATIRWSYGWRMPTKAEWEELYNNTTVTWTQQNGVNGRLFTADNGNTLFLPASGFRDESGLNLAGSNGFYWSSSLYTDYSGDAWRFFFNWGNYLVNTGERIMGLPVRAVRAAH
jgi:hypothetical protein